MILRGLNKSIFQLLLLGITLVFAISCSRRSDIDIKSPLAIVGGSPFPSGDPLPNSVVLLKTGFLQKGTNAQDFSYCTGVIVHQRYILTAAHCVDFAQINSSEVIYPLSGSSENYGEHQVLVHPEYTGEYLSRDYSRLRDVALIKLKEFPPSPYSSLPLMPHSKFTQSRFGFKAIGFGMQQGSILKKQERTFELRYANLETTSYDSKSPFFEVTQFRKGICFGDSGGPAIIQVNNQNIILGLAIDVLFNPVRIFEPNYDRCLEKSIFLNVSFFDQWIRQALSNFP